jgi:anti-sigma B factor antagonist
MSTYDVAMRGDPAVAVLALDGNIDRDALSRLNESYEQAIATDTDAVLLDFSNVDYINSTGIALIVGVLGRARGEGRRVLASGLTEHYAHIFTITRLSDFIQIYDDVDTAVSGAEAQRTQERADR